MPKRKDIEKIMVIGSGPIIIGQAAEFDFSGSQAALSVREEGYKTVIVNSNPATIQTDSDMADRVYVEPLTIPSLERILKREEPDGILSGMGGQTALNLCAELAEKGVLKRLGVELLGTQLEAIQKSEDRDLFKKTMEEIGEPVPRATAVDNVKAAREVAAQLGFPVLVRPAYTLGGLGSGIAYHDDTASAEKRWSSLTEIVGRGLAYSRIGQVLIEESVLGWKEFEYEVMRDGKDNCIIVCNMENLDPMGIHTGESIVVAPAQTLSDDDHQVLRNAAIKVIRALGIQGGCNIQFAVNPKTGEYRVIEVNPRVSRSSALASKVTGYPIARVAAKIAVGMTLDEIPNSITKVTPASFEPSIDYIITKIPRWPFDKFRTVDRHLGTQMKSTGEVMAIGRTAEESMQKALRSLEIDRKWLEPLGWDEARLEEELKHATDRRIFALADCIRAGWSEERIYALSAVDPWFLRKLRNIVQMEDQLRRSHGVEVLREAKRMGFSDARIARLQGRKEDEVAALRRLHGIVPTYKMVDTCAAEFESKTPYFYSTYEAEDESKPDDRRKVVVLGSGPIRIGQGIEFDYACVHAAREVRRMGLEAIMINNNPETVSTDWDTSDRLYFEPLTLEDVMHVLERERPEGVIVQFGGQTSINLAVPLQKALRERNLPTKVLGTPPEAIDVAEDREKFARLMDELHVPQPAGATGRSFEQVKAHAARLGYPVLVRPSFVLGGRGMEIVYDEKDLETYITEAVQVSPEHPILVDKYLDNAIEVDVDAVCDGKDVFIGGILEHIEEAGVHSGDATMVMPPQSLSPEVLRTLELYTKRIALALGVVGCVNIQYAVKEGKVYILEANPRASRTVPFVSKAVGVQMAKLATQVMLGQKLADLGFTKTPKMRHVAVKASVFPFLKLPGVDSILGPEMKSTGEVMGLDTDFDKAFHKAMEAAGQALPKEGGVYLTVRDEDKAKVLPLAQQLSEMGFTVWATKGTAQYLRDFGVKCETAWRISEQRAPDAIDLMRKGAIKLVINTPTLSRGARRDGYMMRRLAVELQIPFITTMPAAAASVHAIAAVREGRLSVKSAAEYYTPPAK